jgi:hypothetical protein
MKLATRIRERRESREGEGREGRERIEHVRDDLPVNER